MVEVSVAPALAVVGHPNKGKSSLVATLAQDDSVGIGADPGTTLRVRDYPMRIDGRLLYTLVDTPGFQRARRVLAWLEQRARERGASAADRPRLVAELVSDPDAPRRFPDECELLRPVVEGAGILYVVDGGVPFGPEYEPEMEILRWTGAPSKGIINPIASAAHVESWRAALGQFFRVVRVIDAAHADFATRRQLLLAFGELESSWRAPVEAAVAALDEARAAQRRAAAREIADLISDALSLSVERRVGPEEIPDALREELEAEYAQALARREAMHRRAVQRLYDHRALEVGAAALELLEEDLFSEGTWLRFGLRRRDLVTAGAAGGAATGGAVDLALGGASILLGVVVGATLGGALGWLGAGRMMELSIVQQPLGGRLARCGPSRNANFPFVLLGRARYHHALVARRTHAQRSPLELGSEAAARLPLEPAMRQSLDRLFTTLRRPRLSAADRIETTDSLARALERLLDQDEREAVEEAGSRPERSELAT